MHVYDFSTDSFDWSKEITCWAVTCSRQQTEAIHDSTNNQIIAFNVFNNVGLMYFLNTTDGSLTKDKFVLSGSAETVLNMILYNNQTLYITVQVSGVFMIIIFDVNDSTYDIYDVTDVYVYDINIYDTNQRYFKLI